MNAFRRPSNARDNHCRRYADKIKEDSMNTAWHTWTLHCPHIQTIRVQLPEIASLVFSGIMLFEKDYNYLWFDYHFDYQEQNILEQSQ